MTRTPISDKNLFDVDDREVNFFLLIRSVLSAVSFDYEHENSFGRTKNILEITERNILIFC